MRLVICFFQRFKECSHTEKSEMVHIHCYLPIQVLVYLVDLKEGGMSFLTTAHNSVSLFKISC